MQILCISFNIENDIFIIKDQNIYKYIVYKSDIDILPVVHNLTIAFLSFKIY